MGKIEINLEKELKDNGIYAEFGTWYGAPYTPIQKLNPPITPKENLRRYFEGKEYEWIPDLVSDNIDITPHCNADVDASDYKGGLDAFGVKWIPVHEGDTLPAFVDPDCRLLEDIADWKTLEWPNPDAWPWAEYGRKYQDALDGDDRMRRGVILSGYFERLISLMGFEDAAVSMITDPDSVTEFFDKLTLLNLNIMDHYIDDFGCGSVIIHDDWAAQRSPFFSLEIAMRLIAPQLKKLSEHAHKRGIFITLHCCGNATSMVPAMKVAGIDSWQAQDTAIDIEDALQACGDDLILEIYPAVPDGIHCKELRHYIRSQVERMCINHKCFIDFYDMEPDGRWFDTRKIFYEIGRELAVKGTSK